MPAGRNGGGKNRHEKQNRLGLSTLVKNPLKNAPAGVRVALRG